VCYDGAVRPIVALVLIAGAGGCQFQLEGIEPVDRGIILGPGPDLAAPDLAEAADLAIPPDLRPAPDLENPGPSGDVAEDVLAQWEVGESLSDAIEPCAPIRRNNVTLASEGKVVAAGKEAVRVDYKNSMPYYFQAVYPKAGNAGWDLTSRTGVAFQLAAALPMTYAGWSPAGPTIVLCGQMGGYRRIDPMVNQLPTTLGPYSAQMAPLQGGNGWAIQDVGLDGGVFSLTNVSSIEFHVDPSRGAGMGDCALYLDDVHFY
jgi:hypothetical protein